MVKARVGLIMLGAVLSVCFVLCEVEAQDLFANTYGGTGDDWAYSIEQTSDGGFIYCGPGTLGAGSYDFWIVKLDAFGNMSWQKVYGGSSMDVPNSITQTVDGGYIVAGRTQSYGAGGMDAWVIKLDASGNRVWQRTMGGSGANDAAYCVVQNADGDYYIAGWTDSYGAGSIDYWMIKLGSTGTILWQKAMGGSSLDTPYSCCLASDGGVVVAGGANVGAGSYDSWFIKLDEDGNVVWQKAFGLASSDMAFCVRPALDGGYIAAGRTESGGAGGVDIWVLKLDDSGGLVWQKTYGGSSTDWAFAVQQTSEGGYLVAGQTDSFGSGTDGWILKLDSLGNIEWQRIYGGTGFERAYTVWQTSDGSFMVGGVTGSSGAGLYDAMILKLQSPCIFGGACPYLAATSVTPGTLSPTATTTTKIPANTSCATYTTVPTSTVSTATKAVRCSYPILPDAGLVTLIMSLSGDDPVLNWSAPEGSCPAASYGIYRGTLPISSYDHTSQSCGVTDLFYVDSFAAGNQYYIVVPQNAYLEGSYGYRFDGTGLTERPAGSSACKLQCLLPCL